jgi:hypothetical protein
VELRPIVLDTMLEVMQGLPLDCRDLEGEEAEIVDRLELLLDALFALYLFRASQMVDRLPALLQRFRMSMSSLAYLSGRVDLEEDYTLANKFRSCAHKIQK